MTQLDELGQFVAQGDPKGFLRCYMDLVSTGINLSIPTGLEPQAAKDGWLQILPSVVNGFSDDFVAALTEFWLQTVKKQGGTITETFAEEIVAIIDGKPKPAGKSASSPAPSVESNPPSANAPVASSSEVSSASTTSSLDTVASQISSNYYKEQDAREAKPLPESELQKQIQKALENEAVDSFLIPYLTLSRHAIKPVLPRSSVITMIRSQWEEVLLNEFHIMGSTEYIQKLSARWFYLVNQKGLPVSLADYEAILFFLMANKKDDELKSASATNATRKPGLMGKLKSLFG